MLSRPVIEMVDSNPCHWAEIWILESGNDWGYSHAWLMLHACQKRPTAVSENDSRSDSDSEKLVSRGRQRLTSTTTRDSASWIVYYYVL